MQRHTRLISLFLGFLACAGVSSASAAPAAVPLVRSPVARAVPTADPQDVSSIDGIIAALYQCISLETQGGRDWDRFRSLFLPEANFFAVAPQEGAPYAMKMLSAGEYIAISGPKIVQGGFHEVELARRVTMWGDIAQVFSAYEATVAGVDKKMRGTNSLQLAYDGQRWWIVSILFEGDGPNRPFDLSRWPTRPSKTKPARPAK